MRSIRFRLHFIVLTTLAATCIFAYRAYNGKLAIVEAHTRAVESLQIRSMALSVSQNAEVPAGRDVTDKLSIWHRTLESESRRDAIFDLKKAIAIHDAKWIRKRAAVVSEQEAKLFSEFDEQASSGWRDVERNASIAILSAVIGLLFSLLVIRGRVFKPLERLSRRMMDFLVDRYSFQFSQPENNEFGDLHRTFNSLAQRVINTMDELKTLDQAKSEFLNIASHELRTPLTSIKGSLSLLDSGVMGHVDPACVRLIKIAEVETDRLIRLINDLLDLAKIEAGKLPLACSWLSWDEMIAKTTEGLVGLALKASVSIKVDPSPGLELFMDRDRVQQVLTNLISNAIKFSPANGWIHVSVGRTKQGEVLINVRDQGPGIAAEDSALIFQKFRQGASPENPLIKGTGLGLAIAKALVAEHGGDIGVESQPGQGSVFWFTLPKWRDDETSSDDPTTTPSDVNQQRAA